MFFQVHADAGEEQGDPPGGPDERPLRLRQGRRDRRHAQEEEREQPLAGEDDPHHGEAEAGQEGKQRAEQPRRGPAQVHGQGARPREQHERPPDAVHLQFDVAADALVPFHKERDEDEVHSPRDDERHQVHEDRLLLVFEIPAGQAGGQVGEGVDYPGQAPVVLDEVVAGVLDDLANDGQGAFGFVAVHGRDPGGLEQEIPAQCKASLRVRQRRGGRRRGGR